MNGRKYAIRAALSCVVMASVLSWAARANVFSDDPNTPHDPRHVVTDPNQRRMLAPIGEIYTNNAVPIQPGNMAPAGSEQVLETTRATAFLIGPCFAMTNYHAVFGDLRAKPDVGKTDFSVIVTVAGRNAKGVPSAWGQFYRNVKEDWAVIHLDPCLGSSIGWLQLRPLLMPTLESMTMSSYGFPGDRDHSAVLGQDRCHLTNPTYGGTTWATDCPARNGGSGSPIGVYEGGVFKVSAIVSAGPPPDREDAGISMKYDAFTANTAVDVRRMFIDEPGLLNLLLNDLKTNGTHNSAQIEQPGATGH